MPLVNEVLALLILIPSGQVGDARGDLGQRGDTREAIVPRGCEVNLLNEEAHWKDREAITDPKALVTESDSNRGRGRQRTKQRQVQIQVEV